MPETPLSMRVSKAYHVFNGDADGIIARHQWQLSRPQQRRQDVQLITGVKRDIALLQRLVNADVADAAITVFDISLDTNAAAARALLARGNTITWFDHHRADQLETLRTEFPASFTPHIDTAHDTCSSLLVDRALHGAYRYWAIAAAYGDNLIAVARTLAREANLSDQDAARLQELGELINYNAYGETVADLHVSPTTLAHAIEPYQSPFAFLDADPIMRTLRDGFADDMAHARGVAPHTNDSHVIVVVLPALAWARRVSGTYANQLANDVPTRVTLMCTPNANGTYTVSIRAPRDNPAHADTIALAFGGGGRKAAAGIDTLPASKLDALIATVKQTYAR